MLRGKRSQAETAAQMCITQSYLSCLERGKKIPSNQILSIIAEVYDTTVGYLLGETDDPQASRETKRRDNSAAFDSISNTLRRIPLLSPEHVLEFMAGNKPPADTNFIYIEEGDAKGLSVQFAVISATGDNQRWGIPIGASVVVDPTSTVQDFDIALVRYNTDVAFKKLRWHDDGSIDLMSDNGSVVCVPCGEARSGAFAILGKAVSVILTPKHGL